MSSFLNIAAVSKRYGDVQALNNVSIEIRENEFFALLGPSGCGKTTLLRALAGFESLDSCVVTLANEDLLSVPANKRPVNLMFQSYALFPHLNVYDNVAYGLRREKLDKAKIEQRVGDVLKTVGLIDQKDRRPSQLSGGQMQRVALARAIVKRPMVVRGEDGGETIAIRSMVYLGLSYDHRVVDGSLGGQFVKRVSDYLEAFEIDRKLL